MTARCSTCDAEVLISSPRDDEELVITCRGGTTLRAHDFRYRRRPA